MTTRDPRPVDQHPNVAAPEGDAAIVAALRAGDEAVFVAMVGRLQRSLVRLAMRYVGSEPAAEDVVQDTWVAVIRGIGGFEGRSSLRTWIFRILTYQAMSRGERERRSVPLSSILALDGEPDGPAVDPSRFHPAGHPRWPGHWSAPPAPWASDAEARVLDAELRGIVASAVDALPPAQRLVMTLRDVDGWTAEETCAALEISAGNQRVLLHRARTRVRAVLETYFRGSRDV
jgi:RNA polymerase sigma-70 factor (ECF subfamily)